MYLSLLENYRIIIQTMSTCNIASVEDRYVILSEFRSTISTVRFKKIVVRAFSSYHMYCSHTFNKNTSFVKWVSPKDKDFY